jgi:hypothetical protein
VTQTDAGGVVRTLPSLKKGQYFGGTHRSCHPHVHLHGLTVPARGTPELALLTDRPRVATITAVGAVRCLSLSEGAFTRLLGPCLDILKRNSANYERISKEAGLA